MKIRWNRRIIGLLALALLVLVGRVVVGVQGHDAPAPAAAPTAPTTASPSASQALSSASPSPSPSVAPAQGRQATVAAEAWVRTWLDTRGGQAAWLARLQPITDGELYDGLALPGVVNAVPRGTVQPGSKALVAQDGATSVRVPTTAGPMLVVLTPRGGQWVVVSNDRSPQ